MWNFFFSVLCLLCLWACVFICALWPTAGKVLTSRLSFVVYIVSLSLSHLYPRSGVVLDCIDDCTLTYFDVSYKQEHEHEVLVNHLVKLFQEKGVARLTDRLVNIAVDWEVKTQAKQIISVFCEIFKCYWRSSQNCVLDNHKTPDCEISLRIIKCNFLIIHKNISCWYSKEEMILLSTKTNVKTNG